MKCFAASVLPKLPWVTPPIVLAGAVREGGMPVLRVTLLDG